MEITGIISAIIVGLIIGALGRLVAPGRQHVPLWLTLVIGIVAAFVGSAIAAIFTTFWLFVLIVQVIVAAIGVALVDRGFAGRRAS
ncbi:GlsB/YeaQ/YmgE family stress response membrane protein [Spiractinospora alimapuensis]|uniref:GlsB/YeaQ/YmgE family stress response membrane protein n=1 Tax=Spiractinospora alimapuensis TaxID=2820884 RepID=UPI001F43303B|nr:GlsB/YeaQ/YmgE family stress response membrane protein [Spiractinospora alimapuensis]QVQ53266.1 GlsB/YeaQ/YmgE family stress response membrane protein [Spiractinospora alimapuensis]